VPASALTAHRLITGQLFTRNVGGRCFHITTYKLHVDGFRRCLHEKYDTLKVVMNAHTSTAPSELGLSPSLALVDDDSSATPYLSAIDTLRMISDVVSPSVKLDIIGTYPFQLPDHGTDLHKNPSLFDPCINISNKVIQVFSCIALCFYCFYVFSMFHLYCIVMYIDVRLSHPNKDYLLTYLRIVIE